MSVCIRETERVRVTDRRGLTCKKRSPARPETEVMWFTVRTAPHTTIHSFLVAGCCLSKTFQNELKGGASTHKMAASHCHAVRGADLDLCEFIGKYEH